MYFYFLEFTSSAYKMWIDNRIKYVIILASFAKLQQWQWILCEDETGNGKLGGVPGEPCQPVAHPRLAVRHCAPRSYFTCYA